MSNEAIRDIEQQVAGGISANVLGGAAMLGTSESSPTKPYEAMDWKERVQAQRDAEAKLAGTTGQADVADTFHHTSVGRDAPFMHPQAAVIDALFERADRQANTQMHGICEVLGIRGSN